MAANQGLSLHLRRAAALRLNPPGESVLTWGNYDETNSIGAGDFTACDISIFPAGSPQNPTRANRATRSPCRPVSPDSFFQQANGQKRQRTPDFILTDDVAR